MFTALILLIVLMIFGAIVALESKDLLSGIISLGNLVFAGFIPAEFFLLSPKPPVMLSSKPLKQPENTIPSSLMTLTIDLLSGRGLAGWKNVAKQIEK